MNSQRDIGAEAWRWMRRKSDFTLPALALAALELLPARVHAWADATGLDDLTELMRALEELMAPKSDDEEACILLYPTYPSTAPRHFSPYAATLDWAYTCVWNATEMPVTQVPLGRSRTSGLPLGVQVVGAHDQDWVTIAVASALEEGGVAGWTRPPLHSLPA
ncbi:amidase signature domain-containing protein [Baffinella frigidus]|nr:amidase signature domain-containing protein [Cryptophyta sp. CCMP2293]